MKTLKAGVIGLGVGEQHVVGYKSVPGIEVKAVCDLDPAKLAEVAARHDIPTRTPDWWRITRDPEIDLVSICSFDDGHAEQGIDAFRHGKHVMIEKPICLHRHEAQALLRAQADSGRLISSNLILRRSPRFIALRQAIQAGDYGEIFHIEGDYLHQILWKLTEGWRGRMGFYCVAYGGGIHLIDLMRWLMDREVAEVTAMGNAILSRGSVYRFDDSVVSLLRFDGGATGKCFTTLGPRRTKFHALNVYGTRRTFINDMPEAKIFAGDAPEDESRDSTPYPGMAKGDLLPDFVAAVREGRQANVTDRDVFRVMDVCLAIRDALETRQLVPVTYSI